MVAMVTELTPAWRRPGGRSAPGRRHAACRRRLWTESGPKAGRTSGDRTGTGTGSRNDGATPTRTHTHTETHTDTHTQTHTQGFRSQAELDPVPAADGSHQHSCSDRRGEKLTQQSTPSEPNRTSRNGSGENPQQQINQMFMTSRQSWTGNGSDWTGPSCITV